jgi:hypothetical protein
MKTKNISTLFLILVLLTQVSSKKLKTQTETQTETQTKTVTQTKTETTSDRLDSSSSKLYEGQSITSSNGALKLSLTNGYMVITGCFGQTIWSKGSGNGYVIVMQIDGNLVLYNQNWQPVWASGTDYGSSKSPYYLQMQSDSNLVIYGNSGPVWATGTNGRGLCNTIYQGEGIITNQHLSDDSGTFSLYLQDDGNLVLYGCWGYSSWASNTANSSNSRNLSMQSDGNLVIYESGVAKWATGTNGKGVGPYYLLLQSDGNLVIYGSTGAIWGSNTVGLGYCQLCIQTYNHTNSGTTNDIRLTYINMITKVGKRCTLTGNKNIASKYCCTPSIISYSDTADLYNYSNVISNEELIEIHVTGEWDLVQIGEVYLGAKELAWFVDRGLTSNFYGGSSYTYMSSSLTLYTYYGYFDMATYDGMANRLTFSLTKTYDLGSKTAYGGF